VIYVYTFIASYRDIHLGVCDGDGILACAWDDLHRQVGGVMDVLICSLACYRLTILLCTDEGPFSAMSRVRALSLRYTALLSCPHCTGVWMALGTIIMLKAGLDIPLLILAVAGAQSFMESCLERKFGL